MRERGGGGNRRERREEGENGERGGGRGKPARGWEREGDLGERREREGEPGERREREGELGERREGEEDRERRDWGERENRERDWRRENREREGGRTAFGQTSFGQPYLTAFSQFFNRIWPDRTGQTVWVGLGGGRVGPRKSDGPEGWGPVWWEPKFLAFFFFFLPLPLVFFFSLWVSSRGILVVFEAPGP